MHRGPKFAPMGDTVGGGVTQRGIGWATSRDDDVADFLHVAPGDAGRLVGRAAVLTRVHVRRVPVTPVVLRCSLLVRIVVLGGLVQQVGQFGDLHVRHRPGSRVWISWSIQPLPSGSLSEANEE